MYCKKWWTSSWSWIFSVRLYIDLSGDQGPLKLAWRPRPGLWYWNARSSTTRQLLWEQVLEHRRVGIPTWWRRCWGWRWRRSAVAGRRCGSWWWCSGWSGPAGEPGAGYTEGLRRRPRRPSPRPRQSPGCSWASLWTGRPVADPPPWPGCPAGSNTCKQPHTGGGSLSGRQLSLQAVGRSILPW